MKQTIRYLGIIGDLIGSRELTPRDKAQQALQAALEQANRKHQASLASRFTVTLGDEFQGLLKAGAPVFQILDEIEAALAPYPCRFGIGLGSMATPINPKLSIGADGEAYWHARDAIKSVHDSDDYGLTRTRLLGLPEALTPLANDLLALTDAVKRGFTSTQQQTFQTLLQLNIYGESFDQKAAALHMGITEAALYRRLKLSGIKSYLRSRANLQALLNREAGEGKA